MTEDVALIHHAETAVVAVAEALSVAVAHDEHAALRHGLRIGQIAHMLEYIDLFVDIRLIENLAVDAHVAGYGINVHRITAGRTMRFDDRLIVVKPLRSTTTSPRSGV